MDDTGSLTKEIIKIKIFRIKGRLIKKFQVNPFGIVDSQNNGSISIPGMCWCVDGQEENKDAKRISRENHTKKQKSISKLFNNNNKFCVSQTHTHTHINCIYFTYKIIELPFPIFNDNFSTFSTSATRH